MVKIAYHSALKGTKIEEAAPLDRFELDGSIGLVHDIFEPLPSEFDQCDFFYADPPYPAGIKIFDERVNISGRTYSQFANHISDFIKATSKPIVMSFSKTVLSRYPKADQIIEVDFVHSKGGIKTTLAIWNAHLTGIKSTDDAIHSLLDIHNCVGDMFCGYGRTALIAHNRNKRFVVSDYNPTCIGYTAKMLGINP